MLLNTRGKFVGYDWSSVCRRALPLLTVPTAAAPAVLRLTQMGHTGSRFFRTVAGGSVLAGLGALLYLGVMNLVPVTAAMQAAGTARAASTPERRTATFLEQV